MRQHHKSSILQWGKPTSLVLVCAWCSKSTYQKLAIGQQYTHGICGSHKSEFLAQLKAKHKN